MCKMKREEIDVLCKKCGLKKILLLCNSIVDLLEWGIFMAEYKVIINFSNEGTRNEVRMRVVNKFSQEIQGKGRGEYASRYTYFVEELKDGKRVFLRRPANLHYGFDFVVNVEGINFNKDGRKRTSPKHEDIIEDLIIKYNESKSLYDKLYNLMEKIYLCNEIEYSLCEEIDFNNGYSTEMILKVLKWLFIEQDIRYWNYSGRDMLWNSIYKINHEI